MAKLKYVNEVEALRSVFYNFFDTKAIKDDQTAGDRVLISMQVAEASMNPFHKQELRVQPEDSVVGFDTSSIGYGYS